MLQNIGNMLCRVSSQFLKLEKRSVSKATRAEICYVKISAARRKKAY